MKRLLIFAAILIFAGIFLYLSVVKVPEGSSAVIGDKSVGPGLHFHPPWVHASIFPEGLQTIEREVKVISREGAETPVRVKISWSWNVDELAASGATADGVNGVLKDCVDSLDQSESGPDIPAVLETALADKLRRLPLSLKKLYCIGEKEVPPEIQEAYHPTGEKIFLIGLDGLDWVLLDRLVSEGKLPTFRKFKEQSAWGHLRSYNPVLSPLVWTSIATSRYPGTHGILDFVTRDEETGKDIPITSHFRNVHTFWNVMSLLDLKVDVLGWWATFPAERINGRMVTERMFYQLFGMTGSEGAEGNTYPSELEPLLREKMIQAEDIDYSTVSRYASISRDEFDRAWSEGLEAEDRYENRINHLRHILATTENTFMAASMLLEGEQPDLSTFYLEGTDTIGHRFGHYIDPKLSWTDEEEHKKYRHAMEEYYILVDRHVGRMLEMVDENTCVIITADHGFYTGKARPAIPPDDFVLGAPRWHRMTGVFMMRGPGVKAGEIRNFDIYDILPTIYYILGIPLSEEFVGKVFTQAFTESYNSSHSVATIPSYGILPTPWKKRRRTTVLDEDRIKELTALGYLSQGKSEKPEEPDSERPVPEESFTTYYNRAGAALERGEREEARNSYRRALELNPKFGLAAFALAQMESQDGNHRESYRLLKSAFKTARVLPGKALYHMIDEARHEDKLQEAVDFLVTLEPKYGHDSGYYSAIGLALLESRNMERAVGYFEKALGLDPADPIAAEELVAYHTQKRDGEKVNSILSNYFGSAKESLKSLEKLGTLALRQGQPGWAEKAFNRVVESDPVNFRALAGLAAAFQMQGKTVSAADAFGKAVALGPEDPFTYFNYGATLAALNRNREALVQMKEAEKRGMETAVLYKAMGMLQGRLDDMEGAKISLKRSYQLDPSQQDVKNMLESLK